VEEGKVRQSGLREACIVFGAGFEDGEKVGDAEEVADGRADVDELEFDIRFAGGDVKANEDSEAGAVHAGEFGEVEDDALFAREHFLHVRFEKRGRFGDERAAAMKYEDILLAIGTDG
jgi:hypothetical protein